MNIRYCRTGLRIRIVNLVSDAQHMQMRRAGSPHRSFLVEDEVLYRSGHLHVIAGEVHDGVQPGCRVPGGQNEELVRGLVEEGGNPAIELSPRWS